MKRRSNPSVNQSSCSRAFRSRSWAACRSRCRPPVRSPCGRTPGGTPATLWWFHGDRRVGARSGDACAVRWHRAGTRRQPAGRLTPQDYWRGGRVDAGSHWIHGETADIRWARLRTTMVRGRRPPRVRLDNEGAAQTADQSLAATNRRRRTRRLAGLPAFASSWSGDGARIVSVRIDPATRDDLYVDYVEDGRIRAAVDEHGGGNRYKRWCGLTIAGSPRYGRIGP